MKKTLLFAGLLCSISAFSQTTLLSEDFEAGASNWTLNGGSGTNQWIRNNVYAGYMSLIMDTPDQPSGVTGFPQSNYIHICNTTVCSSLSVCNANFDTGSTSDQNATMNTPVVTTGMNTVTISFFYVCAGATGVSYGTLQYSIDNGVSWVDAGTYVNIAAWAQATVSLPAWNNQASLKFRFNWKNAGSGNDPAFSVDQVKITAIAASSETITNVMPDDTSKWCYNAQSTFNVDFTSAGTFTSGNIFTAQLSDASGSFTTPITIGTLSSTTSGNLSIPCTIPLGTPAGYFYRIRVASSNPAVVSAIDIYDLTIHPTPTVNAGVDQSVCVGQNVTLSASGATTYTWNNGVTNNVPFTPSPGVTIYTVTGTSTGCVNTDQVAVTGTDCAGIEENANTATISIFPNPMNDHFTVAGATQISSIKVIDLSGRTMMTFEPTTSNNYSISGLTAGTYFVVITDGKSEFSKRIVKQ